MTRTSALGRLPFAVVLAVLAVATLAGVFVLVRLGFGLSSLAVLVLTGAIGALYLREYAQRPLARPTPKAPVAEESEEPFDDPVEEAARHDAERAASGASEADPSAPEPGGAQGSETETPVSRDDGLESD